MNQKELEKNITILIIYYMKVNFYMVKEMEKVKNIYMIK